MTSFQLPSTIFPDNAITRAELSYQIRSSKKLRPWRRWITRIAAGLLVMVSLIAFVGLMIASLSQRDPTPLIASFEPLPLLLILVAIVYAVYLMLQTISLTANSITREIEAETWEMLVLTGINARQIVRGKWWATVQRQFSRYLLLSLIRIGATVAYVFSVGGSAFYVSKSYYTSFQLPHPVTLFIAALFGILFSIASLALSAACGVMASAVSKRSSIAILRAFVLQIVITVFPALLLSIPFLPYLSTAEVSAAGSIFQSIIWGIASVIDNGFNLIASPLLLNTQSNSTHIIPVTFDWMIAALLSLCLYTLLIWFALWRAEKRAVRALATSAD